MKFGTYSLSLLLSALFSLASLAQSVPVEPCGLNHAHDRLFMLRPETREAARLAEEALERETQNASAEGNATRS